MHSNRAATSNFKQPHHKAALPALTPPVERLGIDETRRGKAKFRLVTGADGGEVWEVTADRWHVGFVDLSGGAGLLGQVEGHTGKTVSGWIEAQTDTWRSGARFVAIDCDFDCSVDLARFSGLVTGCHIDHASRTRLRSKANRALPNICLFRYLTLLTCPSTAPEL